MTSRRGAATEKEETSSGNSLIQFVMSRKMISDLYKVITLNVLRLSFRLFYSFIFRNSQALDSTLITFTTKFPLYLFAEVQT